MSGYGQPGSRSPRSTTPSACASSPRAPHRQSRFDHTYVVDHLGLAARRAIAQRFLTAATVWALAFCVGILAAGPIYAKGAEQVIVSTYIRSANPLPKD